MERRAHWSDVYRTKDPASVSWYEARPEISLRMIEASGVGPGARVLDVGGGAASLMDALLDAGYATVGVLDVAQEALDIARMRLGERATDVEWFAFDVLDFRSPHPWDIWHDRAVFHFLTEPDDRARYARVLLDSLAPEGQVVIATFGPDGPERCSGLPVVRYDAGRLAEALGPGLRLTEHHLALHNTPSGTTEQFLFARFVRSADGATGDPPASGATATRFRFESVLAAPADEVWGMVQRTELLREVAAPFLRFRPASSGRLPLTWPVGAPLRLRMYLFGLVPLGFHEIVVDRIDDRARELHTRERGTLLRRWEHVIRVEPVGSGHARYTDEVELDAGWLTPLVGAFSRAFFRHRHRRWRAAARRLGTRVAE
jgi:SAM-dependent methyltransferase